MDLEAVEAGALPAVEAGLGATMDGHPLGGANKVVVDLLEHTKYVGVRFFRTFFLFFSSSTGDAALEVFFSAFAPPWIWRRTWRR